MTERCDCKPCKSAQGLVPGHCVDIDGQAWHDCDAWEAEDARAAGRSPLWVSPYSPRRPDSTAARTLPLETPGFAAALLDVFAFDAAPMPTPLLPGAVAPPWDNYYWLFESWGGDISSTTLGYAREEMLEWPTT